MEGKKLKLVVDSMVIPLKGEMAEAACLYHARKGDRENIRSFMTLISKFLGGEDNP